MQAQLIIYQMKDFKDWKSIQNDQLRVVSQKFDLHIAMREVYEMMRLSA